MKPRNSAARAAHTALYRVRVVKARKGTGSFTRKPKHNKRED
jgi:stalled ribosome alternative rescue factor ArfA